MFLTLVYLAFMPLVLIFKFGLWLAWEIGELMISIIILPFTLMGELVKALWNSATRRYP